MELKDYNDGTAEFVEAIERRWSEHTIAIDCGEDKEPSFSWMPCDSCGSTLGGDRFDAHAIDMMYADEEPIEISVCVDCVMYHANGELPPDGWAEGPDVYVPA